MGKTFNVGDMVQLTDAMRRADVAAEKHGIGTVVRVGSWGVVDVQWEGCDHPISMKSDEIEHACMEAEAVKKLHRYGMRLRGFSPGCQPTQGFYSREDDETGRYWDVLTYTRELAPEEVRAYELDPLGAVEA